jgi:3-hydroxybutyryl-CoA dehydratase
MIHRRTVLVVGSRASIRKAISEADIRLFAELTGDHNPLHLDDEFAKQTRFGGRIAHGMLGAGLISAVLGTKLPGAGGVYLSQNLRFVRPVRIGDEITAEAEVAEWNPLKRLVRLTTRCFNQRGEDVIAGEAVLLVDDLRSGESISTQRS